MTQQSASVPMPTAREEARAEHRVHKQRQFKPSTLGAMGFLILFTIYFLVPYFWLIVSSTKNAGDLFGTFGLWFSPNFQLGSNLAQLFTYNDAIYLRWLLNTLLYAGVGSLVGTFLAAMAGYALAKYVFRGRQLIFTFVLGAILVPGTALALPLYLLMSKANLTNTYWAVLLPSIVSPFGVYLSRIYAASSIPDELLEAARIDGASEFRTFTIGLYLMIPALVTILLFQFVAIWNNYFLPLIMFSNEDLFPITVGLTVDRFLAIPGALVATIPLLIGCAFLQRYWRSGLGTGSVKG